MSVREITIGDRVFSVRSPLPMGTFRRVPDAMATLFAFKDKGTSAVGPEFLMAKWDTLTRIIHDDINATSPPTSPVISFADFTALLDNADAFDAMTQVGEAIVAIFADTKKVPDADQVSSGGNVNSSESKT